MTLEPAPEQAGQPPALFTSMTIPAGGPTPLAVTARIALSSFELGVHGTAALSRLREFAHVTGSDAEPVLAQLAGDAAMLDFSAQGAVGTSLRHASRAVAGQWGSLRRRARSRQTEPWR